MSRLGNLFRVSLALFALVLVYALTLAARNGLADLYAAPARTYLQDKRTLTAVEVEELLKLTNEPLAQD